MARGTRLRLYVGLVAVLGIATIAATAWSTRELTPAHPVLAAAFAVLLAATTAMPPVLRLQHDETESLHLEEVLLVAMLLLLTPFETLLAFGAGVTVGHLARRRGTLKAVFNIGQMVTAAGLALGAMHAVNRVDHVGPAAALGAVAGAGAYFVVNASLVAAVIAIAEQTHFGAVVRRGLGLRVIVWFGNVSLGVLVGLVSSVGAWAFPFALAPAVMLQIAFTGHARAKRAHERLERLLRTTTDVHSSISRIEVEAAVLASVRDLLNCHSAAFRTAPPEPGELGVRIQSGGEGWRWLVAGDRRGVESFGDADQRLLEGIVVALQAALDNAGLYEQVRDERGKLTNLVASSSDGIYSVGPDQRVQSWNPAMERITGFSADDVVGSKCFAVMRSRDANGNDLCPGSCPGRCDPPDDAVPVQVTTVNATSRWLMNTYSPLPGGGYVVVARDVTAQKEVDDLKSDFLATISHELRTPLTPIQGFLRTLLREDVEFGRDESRRFYSVMLRQSERLERLVKDLLDATSLEDRDHLFLPEAVEWGGVVQHVVDLFRREESGREFLVEVHDDLPLIVADEQRAEQVLSNLIANAVKYSEPGEAVRVIVEAVGDEVLTTVADSGPGIPARDRERIFERFTRLGDHLTRRVGGAGLGLYIARRLVEGMGGQISVGASPEGGAAFTFSFPVYAGASSRIVDGS